MSDQLNSAADAAAENVHAPIGERLVYAATNRCRCGAGLAYDPANKGEPRSPHVSERTGPSAWECSNLLRVSEIDPDEHYRVLRDVVHTPPLPFVWWEIASENSAAGRGQTTRPKPGELF